LLAQGRYVVPAGCSSRSYLIQANDIIFLTIVLLVPFQNLPQDNQIKKCAKDNLGYPAEGWCLEG
jgi:hypothetical protein